MDKRAAEEVRRGDEAARLSENALLQGAINDMEDRYVQAWIATEPDDTAGRERLHMAVTVTREFRRQLRAAISSGRLSKEHLLRMQNGK